MRTVSESQQDTSGQSESQTTKPATQGNHEYSGFQIAVMSIRPKTLGAAVAPVVMGSAIAWGTGSFHWLSGLLCLWGALLIQIGTNLANDYFDYIKGADNEKRLGPVRVTQAGLVKPSTIRWVFLLVFGMAILSCIPIMIRGGWPIIIIGLVSVASGIGYTGGRYALAYTGLADFFALIFFGPVAVGGTYYLHTLSFSWTVILLGMGPGLIAMSLLTVNNLRDIDNDREANKLTLAVRFGATFARLEYVVCLVLAASIPVGVYFWTRERPFSMAAAAVLVLAIPTLRDVFATREGAIMNKALAKTGQLLLIYSLLFSVGWLV